MYFKLLRVQQEKREKKMPIGSFNSKNYCQQLRIKNDELLILAYVYIQSWMLMR